MDTRNYYRGVCFLARDRSSKLRCVKCGKTARVPQYRACMFDPPRPYTARSTANADCAFVGAATGGFVEVACSCKRGKATRSYPIHHCAIFGECLPTYACTPQAISESMDREIATCRGCEKFEPQEK